MRDYSKAIIYKIECNITNDVYYGSTTKSLSERMYAHKSKTNTCKSINIINRGNYTCKIIEEYPCNSKTELQVRERWWIENNVCINKQIPGRTPQEWYEDNTEYNKQYYEKNKDEIAQKVREYAENNKEYIKQKHKEYREANKEQIAQKVKEWYEKNKDNQNEKRKQKFTCGCGCELSIRNIARHSKSKIHQKYMLSNSED